MRYRVVAAIFYALAALATANWLDYGFAEGYGHVTLMSAALMGSAVLGIGCLVSVFQLRYGVILGTVGLCFSWPYFATWVISLTLGQSLLFIRIQLHGVDLMAAILFLLAATVYSIAQRKLLWSSPNLIER